MITWFKRNKMKINYDKFQLIIFDKNILHKEEYITAEDCVIKTQNVVKLLGVSIDNGLTYNHVTEICRKAGRKLNVLAMLSKNLDTESKMTLFHSFIMSHFDYCSVVWHFCNAGDMKKIETIQKQALRYIFNDYTSSYADLRMRSNRPLMYVHRLRSMLYEVYRCENKLAIAPEYLNSLLTLNQGSRSTRNVMQLIQNKFNTRKFGYNSFQYQGSRLWNILDNKYKIADCFKGTMTEWNPICACSSCDLCILMKL